MPSPPWSRRTRSRPRSSWATSSRDDQDRLTGAARDRRAGPARGDHDAAVGLHRPDRGPRARSSTAPRSTRSSRVSAVGSGDAFLAGYVAARYGGRPADECLRFAVACGAESTQHFGAGVLDPREVERLVPEVRVETVGEPVIEAKQSNTPQPAGIALRAPRAGVGIVLFGPPPNIGCRHGSRDRSRQEGPPRLRLRRHRRSSRRAARGTPTTSTSPGRSVPTGSSCRCSPPPWTASSRRRRRASSASWAASPSSTSRASSPATRTRTSELERIAGLPREHATQEMQAHLPGAGQAGADRPAHQRDQGAGRGLRRLAHAAARARLLRDRDRGGPRHPRHPGHGHLGGARLAPPASRSTSSSSSSEVPLPVVVGGCASYSTGLHLMRTGAVGGARRRRAGRRLHHARRARHRRSRRPPRSPTSRRPARSTCSRRATT